MSNAKLIRRVIGGVCLVVAVLMLVLGETRPTPQTSSVNFLIYWGICSILAIMAIIIALLDLRALRREAADAQRSLFENTLHEIETEKKRRTGRVNPD